MMKKIIKKGDMYMEQGYFDSILLGMRLMYEKTEVCDGSETICLISHQSLKDILLNQIPVDIGIEYHFIVDKADVDHSVVRCIISDKSGRRIEALGESIPNTLTTQISLDYPTTMAKNRAFDQAVIDYIGMTGKVYSDLEIDEAVLEKNKAYPVADYSFEDEVPATEPAVVTDENGFVEEIHTSNDNQRIVENNPGLEDEMNTEPDIITEDEVESEPKEMKEEIKPVNETAKEPEGNKLKFIGDTIVTLPGRHKDKNHTIAYVYENDLEYFNRIAEKLLSSPNAETQKQADLFREYKKGIEGANR